MLQFRDCPHCGKRIRVEATRCHRCRGQVSRSDILTDEAEQSEAHYASGGYAGEEDFDYDQFVENEFGRNRSRNRLWRWVAWMMIFVLLLGALSAFVVQSRL